MLPKVKFEIGASLQRRLLDKFDEPFMKEQLATLKVKNPMIEAFIRKFSETTNDKMGSMYCGVVVYLLLESQIEANKMLEEIKLS